MYTIGDFTNEELLTLINDIYDLDNSSDGVVKSGTFLRKVYDEKFINEFYSMSQFADDVVREAAERFQKLIKVTMKRCAYKFIAR